MAELEIGETVAVAAGSLLIVLFVVFLITLLLVLKTKNLLCFKKNPYERPFLHSDRELRRRHKNSKLPLGRKSKQKKRRPFDGKKPNNKYQSIGRAVKFPKRDPFANKYLENPLVSMDDFEMDWTNPTFDENRALMFEAAIAIQSWYRMVRYA